jgi:hypothetical protein
LAAYILTFEAKLIKMGPELLKINGYRVFLFMQKVIAQKGHAFALLRTMGHTDLTITKRYIYLSKEDLRSQHTVASPLNTLLPKRKRIRKIKK